MLNEIDKDSKDWKKLCFNDENHAEFAFEKSRWIIRKSDTRLRSDNIQRVDQISDKDRSRKRAWWCVKWDDNSSFHFYIISFNKTDKMIHTKSVKILNAMIKPRLEADEQYILKENRDEIHDTNAFVNEMIRKWKKDNNLKIYFNAIDSSDLSVIETCIQSIQQHFRKQAIINETLKEFMWKTWGNSKQKYIHKQISSMSQRLNCIVARDSMTTW